MRRLVDAADWIRAQEWSLREGGARLGCSASALRLYMLGLRRWPPRVADVLERLSKGRVAFRKTVLTAA